MISTWNGQPVATLEIDNRRGGGGGGLGNTAVAPPPRRNKLQEQLAAQAAASERRKAEQDAERERQRQYQLQEREYQDRLAMMERIDAANREARQANEQRYQDILSGYGDMRADEMRRLDNLMNSYGAMGSNIAQMYGSVAGGLDQRYQDRYDTAMKMLQGAGEQAKKDILTAGQAAQSRGEADLVSRGLASTSVLPAERRAYQESTQNSLGRLNESLRQQALGVHSGLSGEQLNALRSMLAQGLNSQTGLMGRQLSALERGGSNIGNVAGNRLAFMERRTDSYPDVGAYAQMYNQAGQLGYGSLPTGPGNRGTNTPMTLRPTGGYSSPSVGITGATTTAKPSMGGSGIGAGGVRYDPSSEAFGDKLAANAKVPVFGDPSRMQSNKTYQAWKKFQDAHATGTNPLSKYARRF